MVSRKTKSDFPKIASFMALLKLLNTGSWRLWNHSALLSVAVSLRAPKDLVSRDGGFTPSRGYLPFLGRRTDKANLKQYHESFSYSPILIISWVFSSEAKRAHFRSFNSVIVKCLHWPRRIAWIHFFLCKEPCQSEDNQLSSLLELNFLFDGS